ncbi:MAG: hypothetical protein RMM17_00300 [Acidobacteriota bacterium]|nr:hypothetical protein [Blastocatellia bacterium]MDW8411106.1 hypothetical protein [Acidobacteriota bacterium]
MFRLQINLARRPFRNRRLFWLILSVAFAFTLLAGVQIVRMLAEREASIADVSKKVALQKDELQRLQSKKIEGATALTEDQERRLRAASLLIRRRAFSWSKMLSDLETSLPGTIKILSIDFVEDLEDAGNVKLLVALVARSAEELTKTVAQLDKRQIFYVDVKNESISADNGHEFQLEVTYHPGQGISEQSR